MKKIVSIMVLMIFLMSLVPVFADDDGDHTDTTDPDRTKDTDGEDEGTETNDGDDDTTTARDRLRDKAKDARDTAKDRLKDKASDARDTAKDRLKDRATDARAASDKAPGKDVSACMQEILKKQPNLVRSDAQARCRYKNLKSKSSTDRLSDVKKADRTEYIELHKGKISESIEKCKEKVTDEGLRTKCVRKFRARLDKIDKITDKGHEKLKKIEERKLEKIKDVNKLHKKKAFVKYEKKHEFKAREIAKTKLDNAKERFVKAKERYVKAKDRYKDTKEKFKERKDKVKDCAEDTEECQQIREETRTRAKEHLLNIADKILEKLDTIKNSIESHEGLSDEEAAEMLANLEEKVGQIEEAKAAIEAAESKEEVIEAAKTLKKAWSRIQNKMKVHAARTVTARIGGIIVKSKQLEVKLERVLERMTENGQDVISIESLVSDFNVKLEGARGHYETAVEKFKEAKAAETPDSDLVKEAQSDMKAAHKALQEAQKLLKEIRNAIKQAGGEDELEAADVEEIEEEIEEESDDDEEEV